MNAYRRSGGTAPLITNLGIRWRWVVSFAPRPLYPLGDKAGTQWIGVWVVPSASRDYLEYRKVCRRLGGTYAKWERSLLKNAPKLTGLTPLHSCPYLELFLIAYNTQYELVAQFAYRLLLRHVSASVRCHLQGACKFVQLISQHMWQKFYIFD